MSVEKSHFFDQIGAVLTTLWTVSEPCGSNHLGEEGKHGTFASPRAGKTHGRKRPQTYKTGSVRQNGNATLGLPGRNSSGKTVCGPARGSGRIRAEMTFLLSQG